MARFICIMILFSFAVHMIVEFGGDWNYTYSQHPITYCDEFKSRCSRILYRIIYIINPIFIMLGYLIKMIFERILDLIKWLIK